MAADTTKPFLRLDDPQRTTRRRQGGGGGGARTYSRQEQAQRLGPAYQRLQNSMAALATGNAFTADPAGLAPERLMVFSTTGSISDFARAASRSGFELVAEELDEADETDAAPQLYLLFPDLQALRELLALWARWQRGDQFDDRSGLAPWRHLFEQLREVRAWGPQDRVSAETSEVLSALVDGAAPDDKVRLEIELVHHATRAQRESDGNKFAAEVAARGGQILSTASYEQFGYEARLVLLPASEVRQIADREQRSLAGVDPVVSILPQSTASGVELGDTAASDGAGGQPTRDAPIAAVLDAVPVQNHPLLAPFLLVDDPMGLDAIAVGGRVHGTAMSSVVVYGDRAIGGGVAVSRPIYFRPVMYAPAFGPERFVDDRLLIDVIVQAVADLKRSDAAGAEVIIVNLSLGDAYRRFSGRVSSWARALDYLSYEYGILFVVSAGNIPDPLTLEGHTDLDTFKAADGSVRSEAVFRALERTKADRRLLSPAESLNAITVGAWHRDGGTGDFSEVSYVRPYPTREMPNISSALGPGFARAVKPDVLFPGGRERLRSKLGANPLQVIPHTMATRHWGLKVAAPPPDDASASWEGYTLGTSGAAAFASHTAHRIHDELEEAYGEAFINLPQRNRALIVKALLAHSADWQGAHNHLLPLLSAAERSHHEHWKRALSRHLGYGFVVPEDAVACAADRATMWATGQLGREGALSYQVPIPTGFGRSRAVRHVTATAAWFSSSRPGRQNYRASKLIITGIQRGGTGLGPSEGPPPSQSKAGTLLHVRFTGSSQPRNPVDHIDIQIQREADQGIPIDEPIPFGLAVSVHLEGATDVYAEILSRVAVQPRVRSQVALRS